MYRRINLNGPPFRPTQIFAKKSEQPHVPKVMLLTIWFGANDACILPSPQHVPLPKFTSNLVHMVQLVKSSDSEYYSPNTRILLFTPPPINTYQRGADLRSRDPPQELDRKFEITKAYADAVKEVGKKEGIAVLDVWTALYEAAGRDERQLEKYLDDGLHLNADGYTVRKKRRTNSHISLTTADFRLCMICWLTRYRRNSQRSITTSSRKCLHSECVNTYAPRPVLISYSVHSWSDINRQNPRSSLKPNRVEL
jgi:lysophospholipase L1-like esterase